MKKNAAFIIITASVAACAAPHRRVRVDELLFVSGVATFSVAQERDVVSGIDIQTLDKQFPLRQRVAEFLQSIDHDPAGMLDPIAAGQAALSNFGDPPDFEVRKYLARGASDHAKALRALYRDRQMGNLWRDLAPLWKQSQASMVPIRHRVVGYSSVLAHQDGEPRVLINPLLPYMTGFVAKHADETFIVLGPALNDDAIVLAIHEYIHPGVESLYRVPRIVDARRSLEVRCAGTLARLSRRSEIEDTRVFLSENLVRALSYIIADVPFRPSGMVVDAILFRSLQGKPFSAAAIEDAFDQVRLACADIP